MTVSTHAVSPNPYLESRTTDSGPVSEHANQGLLTMTLSVTLKDPKLGKLKSKLPKQRGFYRRRLMHDAIPMQKVEADNRQATEASQNPSGKRWQYGAIFIGQSAEMFFTSGRNM